MLYACGEKLGQQWHLPTNTRCRDRRTSKSMARTTKSRFGLVEPLVSAEKAAHNLRASFRNFVKEGAKIEN